jgi:hypothetical protein
LGCRVYDPLDVAGPGEVSQAERRGLNLVGGFFQAVSSACADEYAGAFGGERLGTSPAEATARGRDESPISTQL